jgi:diguanylate cyclase (GGDEF)-like protein
MALLRARIGSLDVWTVVLVAGLAGVLGYFILPGTAWQDPAYDLWTSAAAIIVLVGIRLNRPPRPGPWVLLAAGLGLAAAGDWTWTILGRMGLEVFPSIADVFYLSGMGLIAIAVWQEGRGRLPGGDRGTVIDALILACGFALLSWFLVMKPIAQAGSTSPLETMVSLAYPSIDIALLAVGARLLLGSPVRAPSYRLLMLALLAYLVADTTFAWLDLNGGYATGHPVDAGWLLGALAFAVAALHPSMSLVVQRMPADASRLTNRRVMALATASLMAPLLLVAEAWQGVPIDALIIAAGSIALFLLVIGRLVLVMVDLGRAFVQRDRLESELLRRATHDDLTGLANRPRFAERLQDALDLDGPVAVMFVDLDDFKEVNDSLGHPAGDELLRQVAVRLRSVFRAEDTVARLGGDEFAVLMSGGAAATAPVLAARLIDALSTPVLLGGRQATVGASVGVVITSMAGTRSEDLMRDADIAMYQAKAAGKNRCVVRRSDAQAPIATAPRGNGVAELVPS